MAVCLVLTIDVYGLTYLCSLFLNSLIACKIQPVDGYMAVCLVLTIDVYGLTYLCSLFLNSLIACKIQPVDGYMAVCLVLTIDVYGLTYSCSLFLNSLTLRIHCHSFYYLSLSHFLSRLSLSLLLTLYLSFSFPFSRLASPFGSFHCNSEAALGSMGPINCMASQAQESIETDEHKNICWQM